MGLCDAIEHAIQYPDVFPRKTHHGKVNCFLLVRFFARVEFPKEILTDHGTNLMSKLLGDVYNLLGIKGIRTDREVQPKPQPNAQFINVTGSDWEQWLQYTLWDFQGRPHEGET